LLLLVWLVSTPPGLLGKADAIAYAVCHRIASHSFFLDDRQFPLCARCTGMYLGVLLGLGYSFRRGRLAGFPPLRLALVFAIFGLGFLVDGANSYANILQSTPLLYASTNWLRLLTGTLFGLGVGIYLASAFQQSTWKKFERQPALSSFRQLGILVVLGGALDAAILSGNPLLLYPLAALAVFGVLAMLSLAYSMFWTMVFKWSNSFETWRSLGFSLASGFSTTLFQVVLVDVARFALTGTWAGFSI